MGSRKTFVQSRKRFLNCLFPPNTALRFANVFVFQTGCCFSLFALITPHFEEKNTVLSVKGGAGLLPNISYYHRQVI